MARGERAWTEFVRWCRARRLKPLPAHPWTVAAYARWLEPRLGYGAIVVRIRAIARAHVLGLARTHERHPTVERTLRLIAIRDRTKGTRAALFWPEDFLGPAAAKAKKVPPQDRRLGTKPRLVSRRRQAG